MENNNNQNSGNAPEKGSYEKSAQFGTSNDDSQTYTGSGREREPGNPGREEQEDQRFANPDNETDTGRSEREDELNASRSREEEGRSAGGRDQGTTNSDRNSGFGRENNADWSE